MYGVSRTRCMVVYELCYELSYEPEIVMVVYELCYECMVYPELDELCCYECML
jgi:hypothetical protein